MSTDAEGERDWLVWQWVDSALPAGGFAHSSGLEAAVQLGQVRDRAALNTFVQASLEQAGHSLLPLVTAAHADPGRLVELDALYESFQRQHVANRASRLQGRALLITAKSVFGYQVPGEVPSDFAGHLPPVFGAVTGTVGLQPATAQRLFLFWQLRGTLAAAVRLNLLGPLEAQRWQHRLSRVGEAVRCRCGAIGVDDLAQTAPLLELWQGVHDQLPSRLFQS